MDIRKITPADSAYIEAACTRAFASPYVVAAGQKLHVPELPGLIAWEDGAPMAHATWVIEGDDMEIITLVADAPGKGHAAALMQAARAEAKAMGLSRLHLETTNDNTPALRFYQRLGMTISAIHIGAVAEARKLKPEIPLTGRDGIPLEHEIELEWDLED